MIWIIPNNILYQYDADENNSVAALVLLLKNFPSWLFTFQAIFNPNSTCQSIHSNPSVQEVQLSQARREDATVHDVSMTASQHNKVSDEDVMLDLGRF